MVVHRMEPNKTQKTPVLAAITGPFPYRVALAGGWIDQPFISLHNPQAPGSMVVVSVVPEYRFMDRAGFGSSTRRAAQLLWGERFPDAAPAELVRALYKAENQDKAEPSGSQDMIGMIYPGINRLDYDTRHAGGYFPAHIESCLDMQVANWLETVLHILPVSQRPQDYSPLGIKNLEPAWIQKLGQTGRECFDSILKMDLHALGRSLNECMQCWEAILPDTVSHTAIPIDLKVILQYYQARYPGAMYSGCGGGYLFVVSAQPVPGSFGLHVRLA
jgi:hypothetical protein